MALSEKARAAMYTYFSNTDLGEEVTSEMITSFPDLRFDELVTKDFLRAELSEQFAMQGAILRGEMATLRTDLETQIGTLRTDLETQIGTLRTDLETQIGTLRRDHDDQIAVLRAEMMTMRVELTAEIHQAFRWTIATMITLMGVMCGILLAAR